MAGFHFMALGLKKGRQCNTCKWCCLTELTMLEHLRKKHPSISDNDNTWIAVSVQRMTSSGDQHHYFDVTPVHTQPAVAGLAPFLVKLQQEACRLQQVSFYPSDNRERSQWLKVTNWPDLVEGHNAEELIALSAVTKPGDDFHGFSNSVIDYVENTLVLSRSLHEITLQKIHTPEWVKGYV
jgi:hypothetical protein